MRVLLSFFIILPISYGGEEPIKFQLTNLDSKSGTILVCIENNGDVDVFIQRGDIENPSYEVETDESMAGVSGGYIESKNSVFIVVGKKQKKSIEIKLKHFSDFKFNKVKQLIASFTCECYFVGDRRMTKIKAKAKWPYTDDRKARTNRPNSRNNSPAQ